MKDAVLTGASEVFSAVVASTLSLVAVLLPVSFIGGFVGRYLQQFSLGLAAAVFFSLLESVLFMTVRLAYTRDRTPLGWKDFLRSFVRLPDAFGWGIRTIFKVPSILAFIAAAGALFQYRRFTWMPALLAWPVFLTLLNYALFMAVSLFESLSGTLHRATDVIVNLVRNLYARSLGPVLRLSAVVVVLCFAALVGISWFIVPEIPFNFVPQADNGGMSVNVRFPPGTPQSVANQAAARVETYLLEREETTTVQVTVGGGVSTEIVLVPVGKRPSVFELAQTYRRELQPILRDIPSARLSVGTGGGGGGFGGSSLQVGIVSADFSLLQRRNAAIIGIVQENPWVADVGSSLSDINLQNDFIPDPARLRGTGLSPQTIATTLQTYTSGVQASNIVSGGIAYPLMVRLDPARITGGQTLLDLSIHSGALQANLQIGQLGRFVLTQSPVSLSRYNRQYIGNLSVNLRPGAPTALEMQKSLTAELAAAGLLDGGLSVTASSRSSSSALATELLTTSPQLFLLALFLSYLVMAGQFNSWRYPVYLLLPVPLAIVGALLVIWIVGGGIDIFGLMGMLMLIGLSSKSAILYLDFVMERMGRMDLVESLLEAAKLRFRPIVMTTVTTVAIAFPLVFARGQGAEFGQRMGIVMFGGIVFSTILTFYIVPAVFYLFERKRHASAPRPDRQDEVEPEVPGAPGRLPG